MLVCSVKMKQRHIKEAVMNETLLNGYNNTLLGEDHFTRPISQCALLHKFGVASSAYGRWTLKRQCFQKLVNTENLV